MLWEKNCVRGQPDHIVARWSCLVEHSSTPRPLSSPPPRAPTAFCTLGICKDWRLFWPVSNFGLISRLFPNCTNFTFCYIIVSWSHQSVNKIHLSSSVSSTLSDILRVSGSEVRARTVRAVGGLSAWLKLLSQALSPATALHASAMICTVALGEL